MGGRFLWQLPLAFVAAANSTAKCNSGELNFGVEEHLVRRCISTIPSDVADRPLDLVQRQFTADRPNQLRAADITYVPTWSGFVYVVFVIESFHDGSWVGVY